MTKWPYWSNNKNIKPEEKQKTKWQQHQQQREIKLAKNQIYAKLPNTDKHIKTLAIIPQAWALYSAVNRHTNRPKRDTNNQSNKCTIR